MKMFIKSIAVFSIAGVWLAFASVAEPGALELDDYVVTPTGSASDQFDTPLPVNLIKSQEIEERQMISLAEIFRAEPGLDAVTSGTGSVHPMVRGLHGERVLVLLDGVRISEQRPGGNHVLSLDPAQIERVEVVRGPASVLYGSDAIGGVVNFIGKRADELTLEDGRLAAEAALQYESATDGLKESLHTRFGSGRLNAYFGGFYKDAENLETADGELPNSGYEGYTYWGGGNYIAEDWKLEADYSYMDADIGIPGSPAFSSDLFKGEKHQRLALGLDFDQMPGRLESLDLGFGWQRHNRHRFRRKTSGIPPVLNGDLDVNIWLDLDTYTLQPRIVMRPGINHTITSGIDFFYEDASSDRTIRDSASAWVNPVYDRVPVIPDSSRVGLGAYLQDEILFGESWMLTPGLRADWIEAETDGHARHQIASPTSSSSSALSGNIGLLYKASPSVNLYGNIGRAFRAPTLLELYFYGPHDVANDLGDPDLDAERSWNVDAGIKGRGEKVDAMLGAFYNIVDDYIVKERQDDGDYRYKNYAEVYLYGAEAALEYRLGAGLSGFGSLSYVVGRNDDDGEELPAIPPLKGRYGLRFENPLAGGSRFWSELGGITAASQSDPGPNERSTEAYTIGNFSLGLESASGWSLVAAVENFSDRLYRDHLSTVWQEYGIADQPGRNFKLTLRTQF